MTSETVAWWYDRRTRWQVEVELLGEHGQGGAVRRLYINTLDRFDTKEEPIASNVLLIKASVTTQQHQQKTKTGTQNA